MKTNDIWRVLLVMSLITSLLGFYSLTTLDTNISGDGVPNRPQKGPPIEYPWDQAIPRFFIVTVSLGLFVFSLVKLFR